MQDVLHNLHQRIGNMTKSFQYVPNKFPTQGIHEQLHLTLDLPNTHSCVRIMNSRYNKHPLGVTVIFIDCDTAVDFELWNPKGIKRRKKHKKTERPPLPDFSPWVISHHPQRS